MGSQYSDGDGIAVLYQREDIGSRCILGVCQRLLHSRSRSMQSLQRRTEGVELALVGLHDKDELEFQLPLFTKLRAHWAALPAAPCALPNNAQGTPRHLRSRSAPRGERPPNARGTVLTVKRTMGRTKVRLEGFEPPPTQIRSLRLYPLSYRRTPHEELGVL